MASIGVEAVIADIIKEAGEERHEEEERPEVNLDVTPPSTTVTEPNSPARTSTDELVYTDDVPTSESAGRQATTTGVVGGEVVPPQQT